MWGYSYYMMFHQILGITQHLFILCTGGNWQYNHLLFIVPFHFLKISNVLHSHSRLQSFGKFRESTDELLNKLMDLAKELLEEARKKGKKYDRYERNADLK
jgi:hypothetical protein